MSRTPDPADLLRAAMTGETPPPPWAAPDVAELAAAFPELTIHELVGQGGMAAVYRATQTKLGRAVALKVMRQDLAGQPQFADRFVREARALAALGNPHVLTIHDFGERAGRCYLVTEFVDGANLRELMRLGQLSPAEVLRIVPQICAGLHFAHAHGVVHRDIKPENVLVDRQGLVKLADFGLAKLAGDPGRAALTGSGVVFGTPHYMAPEQWQGSAAVDHRADIYSLGVVLYELLTGRLPVGTYAPASQQPGVPPGVDPIVQRSLQHEPERRYQSARDVQRDLEQQSSVAAPASPAVARSAGAAGLLAAALLILIGCGGALLLFFVHQDRQLAVREFVRQTDERNAQLMRKIMLTVHDGLPWTGELPVPLPPVSGPLAEGVRTTVLVGGALAIVTAVLLLAMAAWRQTRFAGAPRWQHALAGFLLWLPLMGPLAFGLAEFARASTRSGDRTTALVATLAILGGVIATVALLWRASARRPTGAAPPMRAASRAVLGACLLVAIWCGMLVARSTNKGPRDLAQVATATHMFVGLSRDEVLSRIGPPRTITAAADTMAWGYLGIDGQDHPEALYFAGDMVTHGGVSDLILVPWRDGNEHLGSSVRQLLQRLGDATETSMGIGGTTLTFADGHRAVARNGVVVTFGK